MWLWSFGREILHVAKVYNYIGGYLTTVDIVITNISEGNTCLHYLSTSKFLTATLKCAFLMTPSQMFWGYGPSKWYSCFRSSARINNYTLRNFSNLTSVHVQYSCWVVLNWRCYQNLKTFLSPVHSNIIFTLLYLSYLYTVVHVFYVLYNHSCSFGLFDETLNFELRFVVSWKSIAISVAN